MTNKRRILLMLILLMLTACNSNKEEAHGEDSVEMSEEENMEVNYLNKR